VVAGDMASSFTLYDMITHVGTKGKKLYMAEMYRYSSVFNMALFGKLFGSCAMFL
jgi:hypothetical protein